MATTSELQIDPMLASAAEYLDHLRNGEYANQECTGTWELFYNSLAPLVGHLVATHGLTREAAEDCRQEVWMEICKWLPRLTNKTTASLVSWVSTVIHHKVAEQFRKHHPTLSLELQAEMAGQTGAEKSFLDQELVSLALQRLRERTSTLNYQIMCMRLMEEISVQQCAEEFQISGPRVRYRTHRALTQLRTIVREFLE